MAARLLAAGGAGLVELPEAAPLAIHAKIRVRMPASKFPEDRFPERSDASPESVVMIFVLSGLLSAAQVPATASRPPTASRARAIRMFVRMSVLLS